MSASSSEPDIEATPAALAAIEVLRARRGPIMFHQSGGCCDGSLPICLDDGELLVGAGDVLLGRVGGSPFYIDSRQWEAWGHEGLILDVSAGDPEGFSLPAGDGQHFVTRPQPQSQRRPEAAVGIRRTSQVSPARELRDNGERVSASRRDRS